MNIDTMAQETIHAANHPNYPWDIQATEWPLDPSSVVVEVGGYKGRWSYQMCKKYNCVMHIFEPQPWCRDVMSKVLEGYSVTIYPYALGSKNETAGLERFGTDGCKIIRGGGGDAPVEIVEVSQFFSEIGLIDIDLMLVNIEGFEFELLPHMFERGVFPKRLMVQFHDTSAVYWNTRLLLQDHYDSFWDYGSVLSAWILRSTSNG